MPTTTLAYAGNWQTFTVPTGITTVLVELWGAGSGSVKGGYVKGNVAVTAGQKLYIYCGQAGHAGANGSVHAQAGGAAANAGGGAGGSGYNGPGGDGGGGYTICRLGSTTGTINGCAGGGGGAGGDGTAGGAGGGTTGSHGGNGDGSWGGGGGSQSSGGAAGVSGSRTRLNGSAGAAIAGGSGGGTTSLDGAGGGGGGGGYYGGGGGTGSSTGFQSTGGGGGGSSYTGGFSSPTNTAGGGNTGNGSARLTYDSPNTAPSTPTSISPTVSEYTRSTGSLVFSCHVADPDGGTVRALYRLSETASFTTYGDHYSGYVTSGSAAPLTITGLSQDSVYYLRVYAQDPDGAFSPPSATIPFFTNQRPNTPVLQSPGPGDSGPASSDVTMSWLFSDADPGDYQGSALLNFRRHGSSDGWQTVSAGPNVLNATIPGGTLDDNTAYDWFVSYTDSGGLPSDSVSPTRIWTTTGPTSAPLLTAPADPITVLRATVLNFGWTFQDPDGGESQSSADLGVRNAGFGGAYTEYDSIASTGGTYSASPTALGLAAGSYEWSIRTTNTHGGASAWADPRVFNVIGTLNTPTVIDPTASEIVGSSTPSISAHIAGSIPSYHPRKLEWMVAQDSGFLTGIKDYVQPDTKLQTVTTFTDTLPVIDAVDQVHTWWIRARQLDTFGQTSSWSAGISFTSSHPPTTLNYSPTGAQYEARSPASEFLWMYSSSPGSVQSAYEVVVTYADTTAFVDTGKVVSENGFVTVDTSAIPLDSAMRWRVKVWDEDDVASAWSAWQLFFLGDAPTFTITPVNGATVTNGEPTVDWSDLVLGGTRILARWTVDFHRVADGALIYTATGTDSTRLFFKPPQTILINDQDYSVTVTLTDTAGLSGIVTSFFHTTFLVPDVLAYAIDISQVDTLGPVIIDWNQSVTDSALTSFRVYRKTSDDADWTLLVEIDNVNTTNYHDYLFKSGTNYLYTVTEVADREGSLVESPLGYSAFYIPERNNLSLNPNAQIDESIWLAVVETGGGSIGAPVRQTDGGPFNGTYVRETWTVGGTTESSGIGQDTDDASIFENDTVTASIYVRPSITQAMAVKIRWLDGGGTPISTTTGPKILCPSGVWTRLFTTGIAPSGTGKILAYAATVSDDNSVHWTAGDTLDAGALMISKTDQLFDYFDGSSPGGHWDGDVGLSTSYQTQVWNTEDTIYFIQSDQYWLIDPDAEEVNVMLPNATAAAIQEVYESNTYEIIGRGRKVDYGTRLGYTGEIDCQLRGYDGTPALVRAKVELLRALQDTIWIRTPFGDLFRASLGDSTFTPLAGVGNVAMYDAAIPYNEVCE